MKDSFSSDGIVANLVTSKRQPLLSKFVTRFFLEYKTNTRIRIQLVNFKVIGFCRVSISIIKEPGRSPLGKYDWLNSIPIDLDQKALNGISSVLNGTRDSISIGKLYLREHSGNSNLFELYRENSFFFNRAEANLILQMAQQFWDNERGMSNNV